MFVSTPGFSPAYQLKISFTRSVMTKLNPWEVVIFGSGSPVSPGSY